MSLWDLKQIEARARAENRTYFLSVAPDGFKVVIPVGPDFMTEPGFEHEFWNLWRDAREAALPNTPEFTALRATKVREHGDLEVL